MIERQCSRLLFEIRLEFEKVHGFEKSKFLPKLCYF